jgi:hypothetical protein
VCCWWSVCEEMVLRVGCGVCSCGHLVSLSAESQFEEQRFVGTGKGGVEIGWSWI